MIDEHWAPVPRAISHLLASVLTVSLAALAAMPCKAATIVVSNTNASGAGSLQQAILDANAASGLDIIIFQIPGEGVQTISPAAA